MTRPANQATDVAIVAAVSLLTNFVYFHFTAADYFFPDSFTYLAPARNLLRGLGFVTRPGVAETMRTPGYPLLLAAFGTRVVPVIVLQHLMNVAIAVAILIMARRRTDRFIAFTAAMLFAIDTPSIHYANKILTETLFTLVLVVVFALALELRALPVAGLLSGVLVLIRPVAIVYFIVVAIYLAMRRVHARAIIVFALLAALLPSGWGLRNLARTGVFTVSSIAGANMLTHRAAGVLAILDDGEDFAVDLGEEQKALRDDADDEIQETLKIPDAQELPHAVRARFYSRIALRIIAQHPLAFAELTLRGLLVNIFDSRWDAMSIVSRLHESIVHIALDAWTAALFVLFVVGSLALWRGDRALALLIVLTVAYYIVMSAGGEAESRFRVPVVPLMLIASAAGVEAIRRGVRASS